MTLLEYACTELMGPAASESYGTSTWSCPRHEDNHPSFTTRPPKDCYKDRFQCWSCGWWGDIYDLLKEFYPTETFGHRRVRVAAMRIDFEKRQPPERPFLSGDRGRSESDSGGDPSDWNYPLDRRSIAEAENLPPVDEAIANIRKALGLDGGWQSGEDLWQIQDTRKEQKVMEVAATVLKVCLESRIHPAVLASRCGSQAWWLRSQLGHVGGCGDDECDAFMCRALRGLSPVPQEEIALKVAAKMKRRERIRRGYKKRAVKKHRKG